MATLTVRLEPARDGSIALIAGPAAYTSKRPVVVMIHGALRHAGVLLDWRALLQPTSDVVFAELPGHGRSPPIVPATVEAFANNVLDAVRSALADRHVIVVGESLGGLVALAIAGMPCGPVRAVLAADPPLTTGKLWHVANAVGGALGQAPNDAFLRSFADRIFGLDPNARADRIYYPLLGRARIPVHIVTGDLPLLPPRNVAGVPCCVDDVDRFVLNTLYADQVQLHQIADCGHLVLTDRRPACLELIRTIQNETA